MATHEAQTGDLVGTLNVQAGDGPIKGLEVVRDGLVTCSQSGAFRVWKHCSEEAHFQMEVGPDIFRMRQNPFSDQIFATGGKENELKLWDLNSSSASNVFVAKNVRNDHLDLRVPVWVTDFRFWEDSKIVVGTGYSKIRVYDTKCGQRRPVVDISFDEYPLTCVSLGGDRSPNSILVGNTHGRVALFDLRKQRLVHAFKGFSGSVRAIEVHPSKPYVVSCSLDRILRVHDFERHVLLSKIYLKSRLSSLLLRTAEGKQSIRLHHEEIDEECENQANEDVPKQGSQDQLMEEDSDDDKLWNKMGIQLC